MTEGTIYKKAASVALTSTIYRTVVYRLPATQFDDKQCTKLNFALHNEIIAKIGINKRIALAYRYGPPSHNGLGFMNVRLEQFVSHLLEFILHANRSTLNGLVTNAQIEVCQLHTGTESHLWRIPFPTIAKLIPSCEIRYMLQECHHYNIQLCGNYSKPTLQRTNDFFLMDNIFESHFSQKEIIKINHCRLYLQVLMLSDIATGDGCRVDPNMYNGDITTSRRSNLKWPRQKKPPPSSWKLWRLAIDTVWSQHKTIVPPLGAWINTPHQHWTWRHDRPSNSLYHVTREGGISVHREVLRSARRAHSFFSSHSEQCMTLPITATPVVPTICNDGYQLPLPPQPTLPTTYYAAIDKFDEAIRGWMEHSFFHDPELNNCMTLIEHHQALLVVDGSFLPDSNIATAAWVLAGPSGPMHGVGYAWLSDGHYDNDPYRAEIFGLCMALVVVQAICTLRPDLTGSITLSCDNDAALRQGIEYNIWPKVQSSHFDLLSLAHRLRQKIHIQLKYSKVTGHQDRVRPHRLTRLEVLNIIANEAAKTMAYQVERQRHVQQSNVLPSLQWKIRAKERFLKKNIRVEIQNIVHGRELKKFWMSKGKFTENAITRIDWMAMREAVKRKTKSQQRWAAKFISGFCGSYYKLYQMGKQSSPLCPRCGLFIETTAHILHCQRVKSTESRSKALENLSTWFDNNQTRWSIKETIMSTLLSVQPSSTLSSHVPFNPYDGDTSIAARRQDEIGLHNFIEGFICTEWRIIMGHYYRLIKSTRTALSWAAGLHLQLQLFAKSQWDHRNSVVHARNEHGRKLTSERNIAARLEHQLRLGIKFLPTNLHHLVNFTVDSTLKEPRSKLITRLHHLELVRPFYEEKESQEINDQRIFFRHWLRQ